MLQYLSAGYLLSIKVVTVVLQTEIEIAPLKVKILRFSEVIDCKNKWA
jgi:hypothetical protein